MLNKMTILAALTFVALMSIGCGESPTAPTPGPTPDPTPVPVPTQASISGAIALDPGVSVDLTNARAAVYDSPENFWADAWTAQAAVTRSGVGFTFNVGPLNPGTYYLDLWKDNNNDGVINGGDFYGVYTTSNGYLRPIQVLASSMTPVDFNFSLGKSLTDAVLGKQGVNFQ